MKRRVHAGSMRSGGSSLNAFTDGASRAPHLPTRAPEPLPDAGEREIRATVDAVHRDRATKG